MTEKPVQIANFRTRRDAEMASQLLANQGIPFVIQSAEGMLHGPVAPFASILVRAEHAEAARSLLEDAEVIESDEAE